MIRISFLKILVAMLLLAQVGLAKEKVDTVGPRPLPVKVVIVTMFEIGAEAGDKPGELQIWLDNKEFPEVFPFQGYRDLYYDPKGNVLLMATGIGTARSSQDFGDFL